MIGDNDLLIRIKTILESQGLTQAKAEIDGLITSTTTAGAGFEAAGTVWARSTSRSRNRRRSSSFQRLLNEGMSTLLF